jgi:hypothetical protein
VDYLREGGRQFADEGWRVLFDSNDAQWDAMLTGLLLARQEFGSRIDVTGDDDFRERTVMLVVAYRLDIAFGDNQMDTRRLELMLLQQGRTNARAAQKDGPAILQERPTGRSPEPRLERESEHPSPDGPER